MPINICLTNFIHKQMIDKKLCDKLIDYFEKVIN